MRLGSRWKIRCKKWNKKDWSWKMKDNQQKEKGVVSNKKNKFQRRMKIGELKEICSRPEVVEGKRGIDEKQPFQLPDFIAATGIEKIRQAYIEKEDMNKTLKQKQREPKMGKMDIDYQILHDAFFKYQTKPKLTNRGGLYHEGKEFEVKLTEMKKPAGTLSHWHGLIWRKRKSKMQEVKRWKVEEKGFQILGQYLDVVLLGTQGVYLRSNTANSRN
ncbi:hypothetical protein Ddye_013561 [Dipteronia dyeriana]|uniref:DUF382 domain-containing protein n=1 Tax=Dipteronia dyeriana TaxID=168575 RepID=A0AAD9X6I5_9ROSI|nr:hypothetical protein Ddye_013561 [Dipteronia dyeriana]